MQTFGWLCYQLQHQAILVRRLVKVFAFATSEDVADAAVSHTARDVAVVMDAAAQAIVATSVVRVLTQAMVARLFVVAPVH